jgi:hypothetical protein
MVKQLGAIRKVAVGAGADQHMGVFWPQGKVFVEIAFPVRDNRNARCLRQNLAGPLCTIQPLLRCLLCQGSLCMMRYDLLLAVPYGNVGKADEFSARGIDDQHRVHQNPTQKATPANRPKPVLPYLGAAQDNLARILKGQNVPALNPLCGSSPRSFAQSLNRHRRIAQETAKPDLATSQTARQFKNA